MSSIFLKKSPRNSFQYDPRVVYNFINSENLKNKDHSKAINEFSKMFKENSSETSSYVTQYLTDVLPSLVVSMFKEKVNGSNNLDLFLKQAALCFQRQISHNGITEDVIAYKLYEQTFRRQTGNFKIKKKVLEYLFYNDPFLTYHESASITEANVNEFLTSPFLYGSLIPEGLQVRGDKDTEHIEVNFWALTGKFI